MALINKIIVSLAIALFSFPSIADTDLDEELSGFDEPIDNNVETIDLDDVLDGFDDDSEPVTPELLETNEQNNAISFFGNVGLATNFAIAHNKPLELESDYRGLNKLKFSADLLTDFTIKDNWKGKLGLQVYYDPIYQLYGSDDYNDDVLAVYESEFEINDAYIIGSLRDNVDLKIGRQIEVWGKSDSIRVTDVINPLDNREPGLVDIEDLRLPVLMSKLSYYSGNWAYNLFAIHEQRNPKEPAVDSEFFPVSRIFPNTNINFSRVDDGEISFSDSTFAISIDGRFSGWDLSFYAGEVTDSRWHFENNGADREYGQIELLGVATNVVLNSFLLKAEIAILDNLQYSTTLDTKKRIDSLVGVEYSGFSDWQLSVEYATRKIKDYEPQMINLPDQVEEETDQIAIRASYSFSNDNAMFSFLSSTTTGDKTQGGFNRLWLDYDVSDNTQLSVGYIDYRSGTNLFWQAISENDRLFFNAKYSF